MSTLFCVLMKNRQDYKNGNLLNVQVCTKISLHGNHKDIKKQKFALDIQNALVFAHSDNWCNRQHHSVQRSWSTESTPNERCICEYLCGDQMSSLRLGRKMKKLFQHWKVELRALTGRQVIWTHLRMIPSSTLFTNTNGNCCHGKYGNWILQAIKTER